MTLNTRIMHITDLDHIIKFEKQILSQTVTDEMEREIQSWNSRWRSESLNHYLPMGWSFVAFDKPNHKENNSSHSTDENFDHLRGYFIAQPLLFFDGQTQSLWVEHFQCLDETAAQDLFELAYRLAREKHFQKVYFPAKLLQSPAIAKLADSWKSMPWEPETIFLKTTKG